MPKINPLIMRYYKNNRKLKASNVQIPFTKEQIEERIKCSDDPIYFIENYVKIVTLDKGLVDFKLYDFQKEFINAIHNNRFIIAKLPRQVGKSTATIAYILWLVLFGPMQNIGILANKAATSREILSKLQLAYEYIPLWMQQGVVTWNKGYIELENGSKVIAASTSSSAARGYAYNLIMLDEFAFVPHTIADEFMTSVYPTITSGKTTKVVMVSTPNGMNLFYKYWMDAINGKNKYVPIEAHWSVVPGRDQKWYEDTLANMGQEKFNQEFGCEFLGSKQTLIATSKLKEMPWKTPIFHKNNIKMYEYPKENHVYCIVADVSKGQGLDYCACSVIDITEMPYRQVCVYRNNKLDPLIYPTILFNIAKKYNNAWILVEVNPPGDQVAKILHDDLEYEFLFYTTTRGRGGQQLSAGFKNSSKVGVTMSHPVKIKGCTNLKSMIESNQLIIQDYDTIEELSNFTIHKNSYAAAEGKTDDIVMGLVMFGWLNMEKLFKDITDLDLRKKIQEGKINESKEQVMPFGFKDDILDENVFIDSNGETWTVVDNELNRELRRQQQFWNDIHYTMDDDNDNFNL